MPWPCWDFLLADVMALLHLLEPDRGVIEQSCDHNNHLHPRTVAFIPITVDSTLPSGPTATAWL